MLGFHSCLPHALGRMEIHTRGSLAANICVHITFLFLRIVCLNPQELTGSKHIDVFMADGLHSFTEYLLSICWGTRTVPGAGGVTVIEAAKSMLFWNLPPVEGEEHSWADKQVHRIPARRRPRRRSAGQADQADQADRPAVPWAGAEDGVAASHGRSEGLRIPSRLPGAVGADVLWQKSLPGPP